MSRLIRIYFRRSVQALCRLRKISRADVKIEQLEQGGAVIGLSVRRVIQLAQKLEHLLRRPPRSGNVFHDRDELAPLAAPSLELLQLPRQRHGLFVLLTVQKTSNQPDYLLHARRVRLKQLPYQRLGFRKSSRSHEGIRISLAELRRHRTR